MTLDWTLREPGADAQHRHRAAGLWDDRSLGEVVTDAVSGLGPAEIRIWSTERPDRRPVAEVFDAARRFAGWLVSIGVRPGDGLAFQLPNSIDAAIVFWGAALAGAVVTPIVHFYGEHEVAFIVEQSRPKVFVGTDDRWAGLVGANGDCTLVSASSTRHDNRLMGAPIDGPPIEAPVRVDPAMPAALAYTSGTTSDPKGVIHTHRSLGAELRQLLAVEPPTSMPALIGAPVGHMMGMLGGLLIPPASGRSIHLIDRWDPSAVLHALHSGGLRFGGGATYFLSSLLDSPERGDEHGPHLAFAGLGGSPVPTPFAERAERAGVTVCRVYGSSEHPSITHGRFDTPVARRVATDGTALAGVELRLVDDEGGDCDAGRPGEIWSRGPDLFAGYTDHQLTERAIDADGWYHTGDVGVLDDAGALTIVDRLQDIIIRGGENISAAEVEEALLGIASIGEVAVVAAPDERLGEHGCAFVLTRPGAAAPQLSDVREHLGRVGLAKQKWPEEIRVVSELPRTPSGKVKKHVLRQQLRAQATP